MQQFAYQSDFAAWALQQAELMRSGRFAEMDWLNIIEEMEDMGKSQHRALNNRLIILIGHLLKWQFQPEMNHGNSWRLTIAEQRRAIRQLCKESPSLKAKFHDNQWFNEIWQDALDLAYDETGLPQNTLPEQPIWSLDAILETGFFPDSSTSN